MVKVGVGEQDRADWAIARRSVRWLEFWKGLNLRWQIRRCVH
jgi:hypothetical protein